MLLTPFQRMLVTVSDSLTPSEQSAVLGFSGEDIQRLKDLIRDVAIRNQAEALKAPQTQPVNPKKRGTPAVRAPSAKPPVKKQPPLRKCPHCDAMVRIDHMEDHRQKVHAKPQKGKRLKGKQLRASRLKGAPKLGFKTGSTAPSKSVRVVQGGLCNGR
jgi:hypothetical protein